MNLAESTVVDDRYEIIDLLGEGGMGQVYRAREVGLERLVALKLLHRSLIADSESRARFYREADVCSRLSHPNIGTFYRFGFWQDQYPYLAMEYLEGQSLRQVLTVHERLPWRSALSIVKQIADAMQYAHDSGVLHRDLKPNNVILQTQPEGDDTVKVLDFGLARMIGEQQQQKLTQTGELVGSVFYLSPEQCKGLAVDARSDVYALGCILYELLTGLPPFTSDNPVALLHLHACATHKSLQSFQFFDCPVELDKVIAGVLAKDPDARYKSMTSLKADLERIEKGEQPLNAQPAFESEQNPRRFRLVVRSSVVVGLVGLVICFFSDPGFGAPIAFIASKLPCDAEPQCMQLSDLFAGWGRPKASEEIFRACLNKCLLDEPLSSRTATLIARCVGRNKQDLRDHDSCELLLRVMRAFAGKKSKELSTDEQIALGKILGVVAASNLQSAPLFLELHQLKSLISTDELRSSYARASLAVAARMRVAQLYSFHVELAEAESLRDPALARNSVNAALTGLEQDRSLSVEDNIAWRMRVVQVSLLQKDRESVLKQASDLEALLQRGKFGPMPAAVSYFHVGDLYAAGSRPRKAIDMNKRSYDLTAPGIQRDDRAERIVYVYRDELKDVKSAFNFLHEHIANLDGQPVRRQELYAELLVSNNRPGEALEVADKYLRVKNPTAWIRIVKMACQTYWDKGNNKKAANYIERQFTQCPAEQYLSLRVLNVAALRFSEKFEQAIEEARRVLKLKLTETERADCLAILVDALNTLGKSDVSVSVIQENKELLTRKRADVVLFTGRALAGQNRSNMRLLLFRDFYDKISDGNRIEIAYALAALSPDPMEREKATRILADAYADPFSPLDVRENAAQGLINLGLLSRVEAGKGVRRVR